MKCQPIPITQWEKNYSNGYTIITAKSPCQHQQGLQGAKFLSPKTFILFLNISPGSFFHTKNCYFPIDIIALDFNNTILAVWTADPNKSRVGPMPKGTVKVVETLGSWAAKTNIKVGDNIPFILV